MARRTADDAETGSPTEPALPRHDGVIPIGVHSLDELLDSARACTLCAAQLPLGPRPILSAGTSARVLLVGHAPGTRVHETGIAWNDPSGERLREWLHLDREAFYDAGRIAIVPTGLCYPGAGRGGDLPPRPECAQRWHPPLRAALPDVRLTLLIGAHAQAYYLPRSRGSLSDRVAAFREHLPNFFPLPHPSPRNRRWLAQRPWFEREVVPALQHEVREALSG